MIKRIRPIVSVVNDIPCTKQNKSFSKCLKNQPCDVIKMRDERSGKKPSKMDNPSFFFDVTSADLFRHFVLLRQNFCYSL